jgi:beta-lactamase superfamily II metal-dependent hydrolase
MKVTKYEIDMLNVGAADAFLIHFFDDKTDYEYIVLIDGGNYEDGAKVAQFIRDNYKQQYIDLAICTHCDKDHFGGIQYLLEQQRDGDEDNMDIRSIWVNDPAKHVSLGEIKWIRTHQSLVVKARSVYDLKDENLLDILDELHITWKEPFSDCGNTDKYAQSFGNVIEVLGPTEHYYRTLVPEFRNDLKKKTYDTDEHDDQIANIESGRVLSKTLEDAGDDPSSQNQSSVIVRFKPSDGKAFLFMGDAGRDAIRNMPQDIANSLSSTTWLKVPHHGSKYNMDSDMINLIRPEVAYISTEKYGHYMSKAVVNALQKVGTDVYSTSTNGNMCYHKNTPSHHGYSPATPIGK